MKLRAAHLPLWAAWLAGCGGSAPPPIPPTPIAVAPVGDPTKPTTGPDLSMVPPPGAAKEFTAARVAMVPTKSGARAIAITDHALPIVHLRFVFRAGNAAASLARKGGLSRAGIADIVANMLRDGGAGRWSGRELESKIDALGADLSVDTGIDRVVLGLSVTRDKLEAALELLSAIAFEPRFDKTELQKLLGRELDRVKQAATSSGGWMARMAMYRTIFGDGHPYAEPDGTPETIARIKHEDVVEFWKKNYVAGNTTIVIAGDVEPTDLTPLLDRALAKLGAAAAPALTFPALPKRTGRTVLLIRKTSAQADVLVAEPTIARSDPHWPELQLALHSLGGGMTSRLFLDVREHRSLAYSTGANARELAHGPSIVALYAGTQTKLAPQGVAALLENLRAIGSTSPLRDEELATARRSVDQSFVYRLETIGAVASLAIDKEILGLPGTDVYGYLDGYRSAIRNATRDGIEATLKEHLRDDAVVIAVAGDEALAGPLSRFGAVTVLDAQHGFSTVRSLAMDPGASLEVAAPAGAKP